MKRLILLIPFLFAFATVWSQTKTDEFEGKIVEHTGKQVKIALKGSCPSNLAGDYRLEKHFVQEIFGSTATGWMTVASVQLSQCQNGSLLVTLTAEKGEILVNGEKVDHFKVGNIVKVVSVAASTN